MHQTKHNHSHRDHFKTLRLALGLLLLSTTLTVFAQDNSDETLLPSYDEVSLCSDPVSSYSCLSSDPDPTIDEQWEHTVSDEQHDDPTDDSNDPE